MKYKLTIVDDIKAPIGVTDSGTYNKMPAPLREITDIDEYISLMKHNSPTHIEHRQITIDTYQHRDVTINWFDDFGIAVKWPAAPYEVKVENEWVTVREDIHYYYIGCDHSFAEVPQSECKRRQIYHAGYQWHVCECKKCHAIHGNDSSG